MSGSGGLISFISRGRKSFISSIWTPPSGTAQINGDVAVTGDQAITGDVAVTGETSLDGAMIVGGSTSLTAAQLEVSGTDGGIGLIQTRAVGSTGDEGFLATFHYGNSGVLRKTSSISTVMGSTDVTSGFSVMRLNATYQSAGTQVDDLFLRGKGNGGATFFALNNTDFIDDEVLLLRGSNDATTGMRLTNISAGTSAEQKIEFHTNNGSAANISVGGQAFTPNNYNETEALVIEATREDLNLVASNSKDIKFYNSTVASMILASTGNLTLNANDVYLYGLNTGTAPRKLIGMNTSNQVEIAGDGQETTFGSSGIFAGQISGAGITSTGFINHGAVVAVSITVGGDITVAGSYYEVSVNGGSGAGADDLNTATGGAEGDELYLKAFLSGATNQVTVKNGTGAGTFILAGGADFVMDHVDDRLHLIHNGTEWVELSRSANS